MSGNSDIQALAEELEKYRSDALEFAAKSDNATIAEMAREIRAGEISLREAALIPAYAEAVVGRVESTVEQVPMKQELAGEPAEAEHGPVVVETVGPRRNQEQGWDEDDLSGRTWMR